jgi:macrolide-specific efflux system membrane fusion protein
MKNKKKLFIVLCIVLILILTLMVLVRKRRARYQNLKEITPRKGTISLFITSTGTVQPQNRLEIKPPISGRVDRILVREGRRVKAGDILVWMSSDERAALIDAARSQGKKSLKYWEEAYKPIPLIAPISGMVIVRSVEPGQSVNSLTPIIVLSDRLIVKAEIDETDIGRVRVGQASVISLDAYPEVEVKGRVSHISYESKIISNVTMYEVDILPNRVPKVFRSGMSANISIVEETREHVILLPVEAVRRDGGVNYVMIRSGDRKKPIRRVIQLGISDEKNVEIASGLDENDRVVVTARQNPLEENRSGRSPFSPPRKKKR